MARKKQTHRTAQKHVEFQDTATIEKNIFCVFRIFIYYFLNDFSKKCWVTVLVRSMTFIVCLNQF